MKKTLRDQRQEEFAQEWFDKGKHGILNLCPRFGKIRTSIHAFKKFDNPRILIAYPDKEIEKSWKEDFKELGYDDSNVIYTTHLSLKKHLDVEIDIYVIDEVHLLSQAQIEICQKMFNESDYVLGLTGTMSLNTVDNLEKELRLYVLADYPIETAIKEGVISDYRITVIHVPLDNKTVQVFGAKQRTEKKQFDALSWVINKLTYDGKPSMFMRLARMRIIQNSLSKKQKTVEILNKLKDERILVFCGVTKIADSLGILAHHSKSKKSEEEFQKFVEGSGPNHVAVVKIGNAGVTYKPLSRVIVNYFDSNGENLAQKLNRCMSYEFDNAEKVAKIIIICSTEDVERKWLKKALEFFSEDKITYK